MIHRGFATTEASHAHSQATLNQFYEHDDFMASIGTLVDMGCGDGADLEWWATRTTRDERPDPLNIRCTGVDIRESLPVAHRHKNITYHPHDFEKPFTIKNKFDVVWCHDAFQYVVDPFATLRNWRDITHDGGMLCIIVPQNTVMEFNVQAFDQPDLQYWNWTMISLIHVLAVSGWDCASGFFLRQPADPWIHAVVYKSEHEPQDPRSTRWYDLAERGLLPESMVDSINRHGYPRQRDLLLPWLDKSLSWLARL